MEVELHSFKSIVADAPQLAQCSPPPLVVASLNLKTHAPAQVQPFPSLTRSVCQAWHAVQTTEMGLSVSIEYGARAATAPGGWMQACKPL